MFTEDCGRDLKRKEAAASEACLFAMVRPAEARKKRKEATVNKRMNEAIVSALESGNSALEKEGVITCSRRVRY